MKEKSLFVLKALGAVIMAVMTIIAALSVIWRILSNFIPGMDGSAMFWANEAQLLMFHWVIVIGTIVAYHNRAQLNITVIYSLFSKVGQKWCDRIFNLITILVFVIVLVWGGKLAYTELNTRTAALELSRGLFVYAPYVVLSAYIVIHQLYEFIRSFVGDKNGEVSP